jgi:hypothetical protein
MGGLCVHFRMILRKSGVNDTLWMCFLLTILSSALLTKSMGDRPVGDLSLGGVELETTSCEEIREADGSVTLHQAAFGGIGLNIGILIDGGCATRGENGLGLDQGSATACSDRVDEGLNRRLQLVDRPIPWVDAQAGQDLSGPPA